MTLLEICVDDAAGLEVAIEGGADRVELCSVLELGGLTPTPGLIALASHANVPVRAMVRPRPGDFVFSESDLQAMLADIASIRAAGLEGVVLGASLPDGRLDLETLGPLVEAASGLKRTLHRAIDLVPDMAEAVEQAIALGFDTILTSGRAHTAPEGVDDIVLAHKVAAGRITIMAGSGLNAATAPLLLERVPLEALHGACAAPAPPASASAARLGFDSPARRATSLVKVTALRTVLDRGGATA
ncbi:copper homeostasis protein CutC [Devosia sp. YIM 151766]|uniref:copper homeostasis protein CutC n=1 Tax=Devosia sp. YIM 151766 TaxID=3017325 RepID=UPI00255C8C7A|nr:copper homeostasis protein CutC [Devosia sp. YIM 151766]WIY53233.1 copper homeostasis protein CutC [Devosia sp. YIM 151766]